MSATAPYFPVPFHLQATNPYAPAAHPTAYSTVAPAVSGVYSLPRHQQAQQLFQKDAQIITPEAIQSVKAALASSEVQQKAELKKRAIPCKAAGQTWEDPTLADWPENDFRIFCGDLGNEVNDDVLSKAFSRYPSFNMARCSRRVHDCNESWSARKNVLLASESYTEPICNDARSDYMDVVVRDKKTGKTKGYGFVSFADSSDLVSALKEMNGKYVGNRPIKLRKSTWKKRIDFEALEKQKSQPQKKPKPVKRSVLHR